MKLLTAFFALAALTFATLAFAQDESPSPSSEEKASATVEATPEAPSSSSVTTSTEAKSSEATPAPEKKEKASATVSAGSSKKESASTSETKKPAAAPSKPGKKMSVEAALKDNENRWEAAVATHDFATIQAMVASDFMGVSSKGKFINKSALLSEFKGDKDTYKSAKNDKLIVRQFDKDVAVVSGSAREKGTGKDGKPFDRTYRFTDTWMDRNGQWQCVASQVMLLGQK